MPLHALLIAINNYHPSSKVPGLKGCTNDAAAIHRFIKTQFSEKERHVTELLDEAATYDNVIAHFGEKHLAKAKKGDTVLVHFSGHGARGFAAPEFKAYYPDGLDENLVCYDSRLPGKYDLADKELAILIERIANKGADVIVLLDCCHSGSGTRNSNKQKIADSRQWEDREEVRPLNSYLNGQFNSAIHVPNAKHMLLAACEKRQKAYELDNNQGLFTTKLLQVLEEQKGQISYADLFAETRQLMRRLSKDQTPQFEAYGYFDVHQLFLKPEINNSPTFTLFQEDRKWQVAAGALHGLGTAPDEQSVFAIYENGNAIGYGRSRSVQLENCVIETDAPLNATTIYQAKLISIPKPPVSVFIQSDYDFDIKDNQLPKEVGAFIEVLQNEKPLYFEFTQSDANSPFHLHIDKKGLHLKSKNQQSLGSLPDKDIHGYKSIFQRLEHLCQWEKTRRLGEGTIAGNTDVKLLLQTVDLQKNILQEFQATEITIVLPRKDNIAQPVHFRMDIQNSSNRPYHFALLYFTADYGVRNMYNEEIPANSSATAMENNERGVAHAFQLKKKTEATEYFKLIVSKQKINSALLAQKDIDPNKLPRVRGAVERKTKGTQGMNSWFALDMEVRLVSPG